MAIRSESEGWGVVRVNVYLGLGYPFEFSRSPYVITMPMGQKDVPDFEFILCDLFYDGKHVITRVDDKTFSCFFATQDVTIGLIWANYKFSEHIL
jgi:hypothetical protein